MSARTGKYFCRKVTTRMPSLEFASPVAHRQCFCVGSMLAHTWIEPTGMDQKIRPTARPASASIDRVQTLLCATEALGQTTSRASGAARTCQQPEWLSTSCSATTRSATERKVTKAVSEPSRPMARSASICAAWSVRPATPSANSTTPSRRLSRCPSEGSEGTSVGTSAGACSTLSHSGAAGAAPGGAGASLSTSESSRPTACRRCSTVDRPTPRSRAAGSR
mmetsp:Transcript_5778/g.17047  ORF Transcript_5778/g.17047 Transcript_5778/m.17047 type:complete len:222 (-) Transcript_5778:944-1609(-)